MPRNGKTMRGRQNNHENGLGWNFADPLVAREHPLRLVRLIADAVLKELSPDFERLYPNRGRCSLPPEKILRALLLQVLYSVPNDQRLVDELNHNFLFRWFVGMDADQPGWTHATLRKNRDRLRAGKVCAKFFRKLVAHARPHDLFVAAGFRVDRKLLTQWVAAQDPPSRRQSSRTVLNELATNG